MKNIVVILSCFLSVGMLHAQDISFFNTLWKVEELSTSVGNSTIVYYHKDSIQNILDYSKVEFNFTDKGTYFGVNNQGGSANGTFEIKAGMDTAVIDGTSFYLVALNAKSFITRGYSLQVVDDQGNTDTAYTYLKLYPYSITTDISGPSFMSGIKVYPNPAEDVLIVDKGAYGNPIREVRILNIYGQQVGSYLLKDSAPAVIKINELAEGFYIVEVLDDMDKVIAKRKINKKK